MGTDHLLALKRFEIELWEQSEESTDVVIQRWEAHWAEAVHNGTVRQRKVVAKAVLRRLLNRSKDIRAGVEWFIRNESQLRSAEGRIQLAWVNVLQETLLENLYACRLLCRDHEEQLRTWFEELNQYLELRFEPSRFSEEVLAATNCAHSM